MDSKIAAMLALLLVTFNVAAEETDTIQNIKEILVEAAPTTVPDLIRPSPLEGIYEVFYGTEVMYVSADGRYVFQGQMIDLIDGKKNLTREAANQARKVYLTKVLEQESISFGPENARYEVTIFTDIDCGYCRKLHNEIEQYAEQGITVNYLLFPRNGLDAGSAQKSVDVWCSDDRKAALTAAKQGETLESLECDNPVAAHFEIGRKVGVSGTPSIMLPNGELLPGYVPAADLIKRLDDQAFVEALSKSIVPLDN